MQPHSPRCRWCRTSMVANRLPPKHRALHDYGAAHALKVWRRFDAAFHPQRAGGRAPLGGAGWQSLRTHRLSASRGAAPAPPAAARPGQRTSITSFPGAPAPTLPPTPPTCKASAPPATTPRPTAPTAVSATRTADRRCARSKASRGSADAGGGPKIFFGGRAKTGAPPNFLRCQIFPFPWNGLSCRDATRRQAQAHSAQEDRRYLATRSRARRPRTARTRPDSGPTGPFHDATAGDLGRNSRQCPAPALAQG